MPDANPSRTRHARTAVALGALILLLVSFVVLAGSILYAAAQGGSVTLHFNEYNELWPEYILMLVIGIPVVSAGLATILYRL